MKAYQNRGPSQSYSPNNTYQSTQDEPFDRNAPYRPNPGQMPPQEQIPQEPEKKPANVTRRVAISVGALAALGAAGFGAYRFGLLNAILGPKEPVPQPEPEPQPKEMPTKVETGIYTVGTDIKPGYWSGYGFNPNADEFIKIIHKTNVFTLQKPTTQEELAIWAGQSVWIRLEEGDQVEVNGSLAMIGREDLPVSQSTRLPPVHAGLLWGNHDIATGPWEISPLDVNDYINVKGTPADNKEKLEPMEPYSVYDAGVTWNGRLLQLIAERAKKDELKASDIEEKYRGILILDEVDLVDIDEPFLLGNIDYTPVVTLTQEQQQALQQDGQATGEQQTNANGENVATETTTEPEPAKSRVTPVEEGQSNETQQNTQTENEQPQQQTQESQQPTQEQTPTTEQSQQQTQQTPQLVTTQEQLEAAQQQQQQTTTTTQQQQTTDQTTQAPADTQQTTDATQTTDQTQQTQQVQTTNLVSVKDDPTLTDDTTALMSMIEDTSAASRFEHVNVLSHLEIDEHTLILPILCSMRLTRVISGSAPTEEQTETTEQTEATEEQTNQQ